MMILVTGGARSGKSRHVGALIADSPNVLYIATPQAFDEKMATRTQYHRDRRPAHWRIAERWQHLDELIMDMNNPQEAALLECITTMMTSLLFALGDESNLDSQGYVTMEQSIEGETRPLAAACQRRPTKIVLIINEVGMGIVPKNRLARRFRDIAGCMNQRLAATADEVWLAVSGTGVKIE